MKTANRVAIVCALLLSIDAYVLADAFAPSTYPDDAGTPTVDSRRSSQPKLAVNIFGSIKNNAGQDVCGLVLANGQFVFSCSPNGSWSLTTSLDANNQITLFGFAEGHYPFKAILGSSGGRYDIVLTIAAPPAPSNPNRDNSALLIGGTWAYTYTILTTTFTDQFVFSSIASTPDSDGDYIVLGVGPGGRPAGGEYLSAQHEWAVLWQGTIIDEFFTFTFSGNNNVSGCYYQISPPGSTNLSRCYAMFGFRSPPKAFIPASDEAQRVRAVASDPETAPAEQSAVEMYESVRRQLTQ